MRATSKARRESTVGVDLPALKAQILRSLEQAQAAVQRLEQR
jgi:hypothetical protein